MALWSKKIAQAEIDDLDISRLANQDVFDLEVSVDDAIAMAVVKRTRDLSTKLPSLLLL